MRESTIEAYLVKRVTENGGEIRKAKWVARAHCPDRFVMLKGGWWVELKASGETSRPGQVREHNRMREHYIPVFEIDSKQKVDEFIAMVVG